MPTKKATDNTCSLTYFRLTGLNNDFNKKNKGMLHKSASPMLYIFNLYDYLALVITRLYVRYEVFYMKLKLIYQPHVIRY